MCEGIYSLPPFPPKTTAVASTGAATIQITDQCIAVHHDYTRWRREIRGPALPRSRIVPAVVVAAVVTIAVAVAVAAGEVGQRDGGTLSGEGGMWECGLSWVKWGKAGLGSFPLSG